MKRTAYKVLLPCMSGFALAMLLLTATTQPAEAGNITYLPVIAYQPETSLIFGAGATIAFGDSSISELDRPDNLAFFSMYTMKNQFILALSPDFYFGDGDRWQLKISTNYKKFPDSFYGFGNDTKEEEEETFTTESFEIENYLLRNLFSSFRLGVRVRFARSSMIETEDGGMLQADWNGSRSIPGNGSWTQFGIGGVLDWDTRDNIFSSNTGSWYQFQATFYNDRLGSDFDYTFYKLDLRRFFQPGPGHIIAMNLYGETRTGTVPFTQLAHLGHLRGVIEGRFREKMMGMGQFEYRFPLAHARPLGWHLPFQDRISGVLFAAAGDLAGSIEDFSAGDLKYSWGFGLRFTIDRKNRMKIRFDMGFSEFGVYPYFQINEAF